MGRRLAGRNPYPVFEKKDAALRSQGSPEAPIKLIEYIDYQCDHCAQVLPLIDEYIAKRHPNIYFEVRYYPLRGNRHSLRAAHYADCAARQGKFWMVHRLLLERQAEWMGRDDAETVFQEYMNQIRVEPEPFSACLADETVEKNILAERQEAAELGVTSTPTIFLNGVMAVGEESIRHLLEKTSS